MTFNQAILVLFRVKAFDESPSHLMPRLLTNLVLLVEAPRVRIIFSETSGPNFGTSIVSYSSTRHFCPS